MTVPVDRQRKRRERAGAPLRRPAAPPVVHGHHRGIDVDAVIARAAEAMFTNPQGDPRYQ